MPLVAGAGLLVAVLVQRLHVGLVELAGAVLGGGDTVEALAPEALKPFLPDTLAGLPRTSYEASRNAPMAWSSARWWPRACARKARAPTT